MIAPKGPLKVAIVQDWLVGGGAELVVEQLHQLYPDAPIYTSYSTKEWRSRLDNQVRTGWLQPFGRLRKFIPFLRIWWFTHLDLSEYDLVISSSGAEAKGIRVPEGTLHINYCHAPTHYYWSRYDEYMERPGFGAFDWLARIGLRILVAPLRKWDYKAAQRPDYLIANSRHIKAEIKKYYGRDSVVIHPPVYMERFQKSKNRRLPREGFLIAGRQTPYKRFDIAVAACNQAEELLTVIGDGPDHTRLRKIAGHDITFLGKVSDEVAEQEFSSANAFLFPVLDDFGVVAVEALAAGTPVIAYKGGGALDYVIPGKTGEFFTEQTPEALAKVLKNFKPERYSAPAIATFAERFSKENFRRQITQYVQSVLSKMPTGRS
ncbi:MAG TPA: glycosyltransferase [Candidatus Saccharimonadia bacterium]|nr:glycosyltransferase [Candidatus Saccharimonadia bacterium]